MRLSGTGGTRHDKVKLRTGFESNEDERIVQEHAEDARWKMSWATKYYTPDAPDAFLLCGLAWEYSKTTKIHSQDVAYFTGVKIRNGDS